MQLWNDYEGKTIAGKFELGALLGPEGRSALFTLKGSTPGTIAVTESLNDEELMVACWTRIAGVKQENLVELKEFGRAELDGAPLTYVVMEATDGNLDDLLKERTATHAEATQVATSVAGALKALHAAGIAHGQVMAEKVVAIGETVKLRTDCIRDCGAEATVAERDERLRKDVQDLAMLLLRALTLERKLTPETKLAAPFDRVVEKGFNGTWSLEDILVAVAPPVVVKAPEPVAVPVQYSLPEMDVDEAETEVELPMQRVETPLVLVGSLWPFGLDLRMVGAGALGLVVLLMLCVHFFRSKPEAEAALQAPPVAAASAPAQEAAVAPAAAPVAPATAPMEADSTRSAIANHMQSGWYVIAYTYNHEDQAWKKVATIMKRHPALEPQVVAPGGHGPFLVAIGGPMTRDGAVSARSKALHEGMPRDTFVRNYAGG